MRALLLIFLALFLLSGGAAHAAVSTPEQDKVMDALEPVFEKGNMGKLEKEAKSLLEKQTSSSGKIACLAYLLEVYRAKKDDAQVDATLDAMLALEPEGYSSRYMQLNIMAERGKADEYLPLCRKAARNIADEEGRKFADRRCREVAAKSRTVSPSALFKAFEENEVAAEDAYKGKLVAISGKPGKIGTSPSGAPEVTFYVDASRIAAVVCQFPRDARAEVGKLKKGKPVTIFGVCRGMSMDTIVRVEGCWLGE